MRALFFLLGLSAFSSCYKNHLYVQQEWVDRNFLASTHVGTPDPRQCHPPDGQRLLIAWDFPKSYFSMGLSMQATVRFWDNTQVVEPVALLRKRGYAALFFPNQKILTYRVDVFDKRGELIETWEHQFWTELIEIGDRESIPNVIQEPDFRRGQSAVIRRS